MELRRLEEQEHQKTRKLWEEVFSDDTRAFLDYYYLYCEGDFHRDMGVPSNIPALDSCTSILER